MNDKLILSGEWNFVRDADSRFDVDGIKKILYEKKNLEAMAIPNNWELAGLHNFNGTVWFIKQFHYAPNHAGLSLLNFLGVDYFTEVWLNWNYLGKHEGYFSPFSFDVSKSLQEKNILIVKVASPFEEPGAVWPDRKRLIKGIFSHHDCRPGGNSKEHGQDQNTGGIWNDVFIEQGFSIILKKIKITPRLNSSLTKAQISIDAEFISAGTEAAEINFDLDVTTPDGKIIQKKESFIAASGVNKENFIIEIDSPLLWWSWDLGEPNLYKLKISSGSFSSKEISFGIREIHLDEKQQFFINGKKLFLRGTNVIPAQFLSGFTKEKISEVVSLMKEANVNIVRVHAHVNRKEFYDECDMAGIIVWQDFSLQWTYDESLAFKSEAVRQIKEMVNHLYNHVSIAVWCCHNEPGDQIKTLDPLLEEAVKLEDASRIVRRASNYEEHAYDGWYWGCKEHYAAAPMGPLVTEFGAQAVPELDSLKKIVGEKKLFPPDWKTWKYHNFQVDQTFNIAKVETGNTIESFVENSQSYQSDVLRTAIDFYRRKRFNGINGIFQFMLIDCWESITWSVVDFFGKKKQGFETLKQCYQPVYVSVNVRQDQYFTGKKFLMDLFIINDLYKSFDDCYLKFSINGIELGSIENISLEENQMIFIKYEEIDFLVPSDLKTGKHKMTLELIAETSGERISYNDFYFSVVPMI